MIKQIEHQGWNAYELSTGRVRLVVPADIGPRVVHCSIDGGDNLFAELPDQVGGRGESEWCIRGGHRLWHSPEAFGRTYVTDNDPVKIAVEGESLYIEQPVEQPTGMLKSIRIEAVGEQSFKLTHRIENKGMWPVEFAAWSLTVMRHGGYAVLPLLPKESHEGNLLPKYHLVPWTYTDFSQPAWDFHKDFIGIDVSKSRVPQKLGISNFPGWSAYWQPSGTFAVYSPVVPGARYPDFGSAFETFHCDWMIELETLSPLRSVDSGDAIEHVEYWGVFDGIEKFNTDAAYNNALVPAINAWLKSLQA